MILLCLVSWTLLTACGEYVLREASFADGWRQRRASAGGGWSRMLGCFTCPWGWSSLASGVFVGGAVVLYFINPWAVVPVAVVSLPALGLGLARIICYLGPMSGCASRELPEKD